MANVSFWTFRLVIVGLAVFAQVYLFLRIWAAVRRRAPRRGLVVALLCGLVITLLFAANWRIMNAPVPWVDPPAVAQALFFYAPAIWSFGSILSALLLLTAQLGGGLVRAGLWLLRRSRKSGPGQDPGPVDPGRRRFLQAGVAGIAAGPFAMAGYGAAFEGRNQEVEVLTLPFGCNVKAVQLTDIHAGVFMTTDMMRRYVDQVIAMQPDILLLTGDYISNSTVFFPGFAAEMGRVRTPLGTFATLGNHENWHGERTYYQDVLKRHGIVLLQNESRLFRAGRDRFALAGIDDLRSGDPDLTAALAGIPTRTPTILLSHRPEIFPEAARRGVDLTLAGHYHGGQVKISLPGGDLSLAHLRTPYPEGLYRIGESRLYVSRGIGTTFTPVRLNAPPEVTLFRLGPGTGAAPA
jgi:predicted MPP superfamily phosphohydrolase